MPENGVKETLINFDRIKDDDVQRAEEDALKSGGLLKHPRRVPVLQILNVQLYPSAF